MSNGALDKLCEFRIGGEANQVLHAIIRKTWGWGKERDRIALVTLEKITKLPIRSIRRALRNLEEMRIILVVRNNAHGKPITYCINETYSEWKPKRSKVHTCAIVRIQRSNNAHTKEANECAIVRNSKDISIKDTPKNILSAKKSADHKKAVEYWCSKYIDRFQVKYNFLEGKDGATVKRLLSAFGFEVYCKLVDQIFVSNDPFYRTGGGLTIAVLQANSNKLAQEIARQDDVLDKFSEKGRKTVINIAKVLQARKKQDAINQ